MDRALREFRIRGVATNLAFLENVITHPKFQRRELHDPLHRRDARAVPGRQAPRPGDQAPHLHRRRDRQRPSRARAAAPRPAQADARSSRAPRFDKVEARRTGTKQLLDSEGPEAFAAWMREQTRVLVTDTTMRDAHQSLLATRMRSYDLVAIAPRLCATRLPRPALAGMLGRRRPSTWRCASSPRIPWERLAQIRERVPNLLLQMLLRGSNARRLHQLPRQRRPLLRARGGRRRHRPLPRLRLPELGREHARLDGRGARGRQALRGGHLLHRRHPRSGPRQVRASTTMSAWRRSWRAPAPTSSASRTWPGCSSRRRRAKLVDALQRGGRAADPLPHP